MRKGVGWAGRGLAMLGAGQGMLELGSSLDTELAHQGGRGVARGRGMALVSSSATPPTLNPTPQYSLSPHLLSR